MLRPALACLLVASLVAGCNGNPPASDDEQSLGGPSGTAVASLEAPTWALGHWWTWSSPQQEQPYTHAVSADSGLDWVMDTDNPSIAFFDARGDISMLGKVRKSDLAGSQGADRVEFFRFPLQPHKNWTTPWDGETMTVHVASVGDGTAQLEATRADGTLYAKYTYENKTGYFGRVEFYSQDGSEVGFESRVTSSGRSFGETLVRWSLVTVVDLHGPIPASQATNYEVPPTITDVYIAANVDCTAGALAVATGPPQGPVEERGYSAMGQCPLQNRDEYVASGPPAQAETWGLAITSIPGVTGGTLDLTVWLRTLSEFKAGAAPAS